MRAPWCAVFLLAVVVVTTATSDSDSNVDTRWHGWFTEDAPAWDSDLGCYLNADQQQCAETHAQLNELNNYRIHGPFNGFFDGRVFDLTRRGLSRAENAFAAPAPSRRTRELSVLSVLTYLRSVTM